MICIALIAVLTRPRTFRGIAAIGKSTVGFVPGQDHRTLAILLLAPKIIGNVNNTKRHLHGTRHCQKAAEHQQTNQKQLLN